MFLISAVLGVIEWNDNSGWRATGEWSIIYCIFWPTLQHGYAGRLDRRSVIGAQLAACVSWCIFGPKGNSLAAAPPPRHQACQGFLSIPSS